MERRLQTDERRRLVEVLLRLADGDRSASDLAFALLWPIVRRFTSTLLPPADADDAAQEALVKLFGRIAKFDASRDPVSWVIAIAAYECMTLRRRATRRREAEFPLRELRDVRGTAEDALIARELQEAAAAALGELHATDLEAIELMLHTERGERVPLGAAARKRVQRAFGRLRAAWRARNGT